MLHKQVPAEDVKTLAEIRDIVQKRSSFYGDVLIKTFIGKTDVWRNGITTFEFLSKNSTIVEEMLDYGDAIYKATRVSIDKAIEIIEKLVNEGHLSIDELPRIEIEGYFYKNPYFRSVESNHRTFRLEWPSNVFHFEPKEKGNFPSGPYVSLSAPLYPDYTWVFEDKFRIGRASFHQFWMGVVIFLPNYKARITGVRLGSKNLTISTVKNVNEKLIAKMFLEGEGKLEKPEVDIAEPEITIPLTFIPDYIEIHILSVDTGEALDFRKVHLSWPTISEDITIEIGIEDVLQLITRGEGETIEFKQDISKNKERFVETVIAFANTYGGTIFVGVDDNGNIVGSYEQKLEETVQNILRSNCEPPLEVKAESKVVNDKNIVVVSVMEGNDKPYSYRGKGVFVRSGSTNRIASRFELDEFYKSKENRPVPPDWRQRLRQGNRTYNVRKKQLSQDYV